MKPGAPIKAKEEVTAMIKKFFLDESGASPVEYGLIMALMSLALIGAVTLLGQQLQTTFNPDSRAMSGVTAS